jgi:hypothetical protein
LIEKNRRLFLTITKERERRLLPPLSLRMMDITIK